MLKEPSDRKFSQLFVGVIMIAIFCGLLYLIPHKYNVADIKGIKIDGQTVKVDLALTAAAQEQGLSGRKGLDTNTGMLFVFPKSGIYPFWMKDMNFPIDIIWITKDSKVAYIKKDATPESYPASFDPKASALYVLEIPTGFSENNNVKVGDSIKFTY